MVELARLLGEGRLPGCRLVHLVAGRIEPRLDFGVLVEQLAGIRLQGFPAFLQLCQTRPAIGH